MGVVGQMGDQLVLQRVAVLGLVVLQKLDLHLGHVHPGGAIALAAFAAHAQVHGLAHSFAAQGIFARQTFDLATQSQAQGVGAATRQVFLVAGHAVTGAHGARIELAAMAVVVAHLHRFGQTLGRVAAGAWGAGLLGDRIVLHVPSAPVQRGADRHHLVAGRKTHQRGVVHFGRVDDALRAQQLLRVHLAFDLRKSLADARAKLPTDPLAPAQAVTVLTTECAFVLAHQGTGLFGNGAHFARAIAAHVQNGAHMQSAHRGVGVPSAPAAVFAKHPGQGIGVLGQALQRHGAVLNEAHRFAVAAQAHHDVQARLAHFPQVFLRCIFHHLDHAAGQTQVAHQLHQLFDFVRDVGFAGPGKLHQQHRLRHAAVDVRRQGGANGGRKGRVLQRQLDHGAVHQLDGRQMPNRHALPQLDDVLGRIHGLVKAGKVHHAQHLGAWQLGQAQSQRTREGQRALAANEQMRQVDRAIGRVGPLVLVAKNVQVVARHAAQDFGPVGVYFSGVLLRQIAHKVANLARAALGFFIGAKFEQTAIGQPSLSPQHVVHHVAVSDRAAAARVVARHAAQRGLRAGGHIHRVPQSVLLEGRIQVVEHQAWLHRGSALLRVHCENLTHVLGMVNDQARAHRLATLAGAAAARHDGHTQVATNVQSHAHIGRVTRHKNTQRHGLVNGSVCRVAASVGCRKENLSPGVRAQALGEQPGHLVADVRDLVVGMVGQGFGQIDRQRGVHGACPSVRNEVSGVLSMLWRTARS